MIGLDANIVPVALGTAVLGAVSGGVGCYAVVRRQSLQGDAISHAALPGIALAYMVGLRSEIFLLFAAALSGGLSLLWVQEVVRRRGATFDSALASAIVVFFGLGVVLMSRLQRTAGGAAAARLPQFLFGQEAAVLTFADLAPMLAMGSAAFAIVLLFWKEFLLVAFDADFAATLGLPVRAISVLMTVVTVLAVVVGLQTVGVVLMSSLLVAPAIAARQWSSRFGRLTAIAVALGAASGFAGTLAAHTLGERGSAVPTGPTIVLTVTLLALLSIVLAPHRGLLPGYFRKRAAVSP